VFSGARGRPVFAKEEEKQGSEGNIVHKQTIEGDHGHVGGERTTGPEERRKEPAIRRGKILRERGVESSITTLLPLKKRGGHGWGRIPTQAKRLWNELGGPQVAQGGEEMVWEKRKTYLT